MTLNHVQEFGQSGFRGIGNFLLSGANKFVRNNGMQSTKTNERIPGIKEGVIARSKSFLKWTWAVTVPLRRSSKESNKNRTSHGICKLQVFS